MIGLIKIEYLMLRDLMPKVFMMGDLILAAIVLTEIFETEVIKEDQSFEILIFQKQQAIIETQEDFMLIT